MPRKASPTLTDGESRLMNVLWDVGPATVGDVAIRLTGTPVLAYNTVQTMLRILERKGYVTHEKAGRAFVYRPLVDRTLARRRAVRHLMGRLFDNSPGLLVLNLLDDERIEPEELQRLKRMIEQA